MNKIVKLITGEDVVSDVEISEDGKSLTMKQPQRLVMSQEGLASIPLMPFSEDKKYTISMEHVMLFAEPDQDIKNGYNSQFGSGIVLAKNI